MIKYKLTSLDVVYHTCSCIQHSLRSLVCGLPYLQCQHSLTSVVCGLPYLSWQSAFSQIPGLWSPILVVAASILSDPWSVVTHTCRGSQHSLRSLDCGLPYLSWQPAFSQISGLWSPILVVAVGILSDPRPAVFCAAEVTASCQPAGGCAICN